MTTDVLVCDHGTVAVFLPMTALGSAWLEASIDPGAMTWGRGIVCEPRYVGAIIEGLIADGLEVSA